MALSGLDIYKLLPKTNCRQCGFVTCLAFAMALAKKSVAIDKCPFLSEESKNKLEASSLPPVKLVTIGVGDAAVAVGNETVMFRHEEKFHHETAIGFMIDDSLAESDIRQRLAGIKALSFERVGQALRVNLVAVRQCGNIQAFVNAVRIVAGISHLPLVLMSDDPAALKQALEITQSKKPLIYKATAGNASLIGALGKEFSCPVVVQGADLEELMKVTQELKGMGVDELILDTGAKPIAQKLHDLTQIRRQALKKSNRALGYSTIVVIDTADPYEEAMCAATFVSKYAGIVLVRGIEPWQILPLLTLRQNIFTDPQKPLQLEPKVYPIGQVTPASPVLITTNFSLSYYTVLGEVEASKIPAYIMAVDTEGMSVLTAWAAEKFTPEQVAHAVVKFGVPDLVTHHTVVIPGYVAVMSGDLEEVSGWKVVVGPKEAAGIPGFLKNM
ncbi:MAG TPA: acetyl-CoA decarbonylase/synthase complex subunit gamma [Candidatus Omnitrophota bacterium]|nr:acetyl-CoA decarbonylase/synthase complex subunit gamma [Candidatus Omnitrophota bacterium]HNX81977.1 acetyl-CoA decarbonylase/synthase complex subunit gamma [Candidatus Omnitrophota bacterium]